MLNKGPFIAEAIDILDDVLTRMEAHQLKKHPNCDHFIHGDFSSSTANDVDY